MIMKDLRLKSKVYLILYSFLPKTLVSSLLTSLYLFAINGNLKILFK